ncbi:Probable steroid-binding protein 3 [Linum perenne]
MFAGKDASRALAKMSKDDSDVIPSLQGLTDKELGVLADWEKKFEAKYPVVGRQFSRVTAAMSFDVSPQMVHSYHLVTGFAAKLPADEPEFLGLQENSGHGTHTASTASGSAVSSQ